MGSCRSCFDEPPSGLFQKSRIRGRGIWRDENSELVVHLGDRLAGPEAKGLVRPEKYNAQEKWIYAPGPRIAGPSEEEAMKVGESSTIVDLFASMQHGTTQSPATCSPAGSRSHPFSGALLWRPHVWLTGPSVSDRTTLIECMVMPLLDDMVLYLENGATEARIRRTLGSDSLPVVVDEYKTKQAAFRGI